MLSLTQPELKLFIEGYTRIHSECQSNNNIDPYIEIRNIIQEYGKNHLNFSVMEAMLQSEPQFQCKIQQLDETNVVMKTGTVYIKFRSIPCVETTYVTVQLEHDLRGQQYIFPQSTTCCRVNINAKKGPLFQRPVFIDKIKSGVQSNIINIDNTAHSNHIISFNLQRVYQYPGHSCWFRLSK